MPTRRRGLTVLEILFGMAILAILTAILVRNIKFATQSQRLNVKLDVLQRLRLAELRLRSELETGTAVLYPPEEDETGVPGMVMTGPLNELRILYLDEKGNLKLKTRGEEAVVLAPNIAELVVRHPNPGQVECMVRADSKDAGKVSAVISGHVGNGFHGEGSVP